MAIETTKIKITLNGTGTEIPALNVIDAFNNYLITGTAVAIGNYAIVPTGTPQLGTTFTFFYNGTLDITTNGTTFALFGVNITQAQLIKTWEAECYYNGTAWEVRLFMNFSETAIISTANIIDLNVTTAKINDLAVTTGKIAANAVTTAKILDANVTTAKLADDAATTVKILDSNVTTAKLANNAVTNAKLSQMAANTVKANATGALADPQDVAISTLINSNGWSLIGNSGTVAGTNFLGTTDAIDLVFKVNSVESGRINLTDQNTSFGIGTMASLTSGSGNDAFGNSVLGALTSGANNTSIGSASSTSLTTGSNNTSIGNGALSGLSTGSNNTGIGRNSLTFISTGSNNTTLGSGANVNSTSSLNRIALGYNASATADFQFAIPTDVTHLNFALNTHNTGAHLISTSAGIATWSTSAIDTTAGDSATVNTIAGRIRKDASGASFVLTNSYITANSVIILTPANAAIDATATTWTVLAGAGSCSIVFNAAPTANFDLNFFVIN